MPLVQGVINSKNCNIENIPSNGAATLFIETLEKNHFFGSPSYNRRKTIGIPKRASFLESSSYHRRHTIVPTETFRTRHKVATGELYSLNSFKCDIDLPDCGEQQNCDSTKENRRQVEIFNGSHHLKSPTSDSELEVSQFLGDSPVKIVCHRRHTKRLIIKQQSFEKFTPKPRKKDSPVPKPCCRRDIVKTVKNDHNTSFSQDEAEQKARFKQKEVDILYNNYIQSLYLDEMMQRAIQKREADAAKQIHDFYNLIQSDNETELDLHLKLRKINHNKLVTCFGKLQRNAVSNVSNSLSDMKSKHHNLAKVLDTVPHQIATEGIFHPNDETYIDDLTNNFIETEQLLEKIDDVTESKMPSLSLYNSHLKRLVETISTEKGEIEQINELLAAIESLTLQQTSLKFQRLDVKMGSELLLDI